jgi:hypothetical protein
MLKKILAFICLTLSIGANAATIYNHNGVDYEISTVFTSWAEDEALLSSQFWWGNEDLTVSVASSSGADLTGMDGILFYLYDYEYVNTWGWEGPLVWYREDTDNCCYSNPDLQAGSLVFYTQEDREHEFTYVVATVSNVPLPAAAWLFGSALIGLGVIKRKKA